MAGPVQRLIALAGPGAVRTGSAAEPWAIRGEVPEAVLSPATPGEAAAALAVANEEKWTVVPAGAGTWVDGSRKGSRPLVVMASDRMRGIVAYEPGDLTVSAWAGTPAFELQAAAARNRQWLPLDPPGSPGSTIGATVALACAGPLRLGFGTPRDWVLGASFVTGDGRLLRVGGRVVKNVAGYDLTRLLVGSRGSLGFIVQVHLRLRPTPEADRTLAFASDDRGTLVRLAEAALRERLEPAAFELLSPAVASAVVGGDGSWALLARLLGTPEATTADVDRLERLATANGVASMKGMNSEAWGRLGNEEISASVVVRLAALPSALQETLTAAEHLPGGAARIVAHAGDGIVRALVAAEQIRGNETVWSEAIARCRAALAKRRGTVRVERGKSGLLGGVGTEEDAGAAKALHVGLRAVFDPGRILAAGAFDF